MRQALENYYVGRVDGCLRTKVDRRRRPRPVHVWKVETDIEATGRPEIIRSIIASTLGLLRFWSHITERETIANIQKKRVARTAERVGVVEETILRVQTYDDDPVLYT